MRNFITFSVLLLLISFTFSYNALALTEESQKVLNNYQNYKQSGSSPATSQPYSPNTSPSAINAVPAPKTNVVPPTSQSQGNGGGWIVGGIIVIIIIAIIAKGLSKPKIVEYKDIPRMGFTNSTKESVKEEQNGRCAICRKIPTHWEFDHINGRGDNSIENCQGLCRDCHQGKTLNDNH